jgi:predicted transcriptional regulator
MKTLTKAEEQIMQTIWKLGKAFLREIIDELPNPKPHQLKKNLLLLLFSAERINIIRL